jgi:hygromycin-B 7''-O-kinase
MRGDVVVKLSPPFWQQEIPREADALRYVHRRLAVATPELLAVGEIDAWHYLVQARLPGMLLRSVWPTLESREKTALMHQHGALMAALHALPLQHAPASLAFDWSQLLAEQAADCAPAMRRAGVAEELVFEAESYLEQAWPLLVKDTAVALLHGDLDAINLLVERQDVGWRISGLVDWGDIKVGPIAHEFISPRVHMYREEANLLLAWYAGYGLSPDQCSAQLEQNLMARTMLYYAEEFAHILGKLPGASRCRSWHEVAGRFWRMTE